MTARDDLAWLRRRGDPRVLEFLAEENARTEREMAEFSALEEALYREFRARIEETDRSVPARRDDFEYFYRTEEGLAYRIWARSRPGEDGEEVYLDENELAADRGFLDVGAHAVSPDHLRVAYTFDTTGDEEYTLVVKDIATGEHLPERIERTAEELAWGSDSRTICYVTRDSLQRAYRVYAHRLGFDPSEDTLVYEEKDPAFHISLRKTRSGRFILIESASAVTRDTLILDAATPLRRPVALCPRAPGIEHEVSDAGDALLVRTNLGAKNFRLARVEWNGGDPDPPERWTDVRAHRDFAMIERAEAFETFTALVEREDGLRHVRIVGTDGEREAPIEGEVRTVEVGDNPDFAARHFRYVVSSPRMPPTTIDVGAATGGAVVRKREHVPGLDPDRYETRRVWATADDGVRIPISIACPRGVELDGDNPCLLNGYGSYGICYDPGFTVQALSLLDRGFVYATAHVRGGGELGETWHDRGKMLHKRNTFTDFIRCSEHLVELGYTSPARLAIQGRSAGGLLMGAVANLRPDLFAAVVAGVPFVDVLATMLDPSIPLTVIEYEEWGDPREPAYYDYIRSYSPFDNVRETAYPHMLVTAGLNDPRVQYWEPARWVARLRERRTDDRRLLLRTDMGAGHRGPSNRFEWLRDKAFEFAFVIASVAADRIDVEPGRRPHRRAAVRSVESDPPGANRRVAAEREP